MIKTTIKHFLYEHAINVCFDNINKHFMFAQPDVIFKTGNRFKYLEVHWLGYILQFTNVVVTSTKTFDWVGIFIELYTDDIVKAIPDPTQVLHNVGAITAEDAFMRMFIPCDSCALKYYHYLRNPITIARMQIKNIEI